MDTEHLERQLHNWNRLMYVAVSAAVTLLVASFDVVRWTAWFVLQILVTSFGFYLLWGKNWRSLPLSRERINTVFGCFLASWLLLFVPWILGKQPCFFTPLFVYSIFLLAVYWRIRKKLSDSEEMFP